MSNPNNVVPATGTSTNGGTMTEEEIREDEEARMDDWIESHAYPD